MEIDNVLLALTIGWLVELMMASTLGAEVTYFAPQGEIALFAGFALIIPYFFIGYELVQALV